MENSARWLGRRVQLTARCRNDIHLIAVFQPGKTKNIADISDDIPTVDFHYQAGSIVNTVTGKLRMMPDNDLRCTHLKILY